MVSLKILNSENLVILLAIVVMCSQTLVLFEKEKENI